MQQHAEKMTQKIIRGVEDSPVSGPLLLTMDDHQRKGVYAILETAGRLMCIDSGEMITEKVTEDVTKNLIKLVKELCVTREYLEEREEHYTDTLKRSNERQAEKFEKIIVDVVKNVADSVQKHNRRITDIEERQKSADAEINEFKWQIKLLLSEMESLKRVPDQISDLQKSITSSNDRQTSLHDSINSVQDSINILIKNSTDQASKPSPSSFWSKIPAPLWVAIGGLLVSFAAGTATAIVYVRTGKIILFGGV